MGTVERACRSKKIHDPASSARWIPHFSGGTSYRTFEHPHVPLPKGIAVFRIQQKVRNIVNLSFGRGSSG